MIRRSLIFLFGIAAYTVFLGTMVYGIGFLGDIGVSKNIDTGPASPVVVAAGVDLALIALFGLQHSVMARPAFKRTWLRVVTASLERSVYVLAATACLLLLFWQWRPIPVTLWDFGAGASHAILVAVFWLGWLAVIASTYLIDHFDLFGLRQVYFQLRGLPYRPLPFKQPWPYRVVRHPLMLAMLVAFWATPHMTAGHLLYAAALSAFILVGTTFEERDLATQYGEPYRLYLRQVSKLFPLPHPREAVPVQAAPGAGAGERGAGPAAQH